MQKNKARGVRLPKKPLRGWVLDERRAYRQVRYRRLIGNGVWSL